MQEWEERELEKRDAREEGWQEGIEEWIRALIFDNLEEKKTREQIIAKLMRRFSLSEEEAVGYYSECMEMSAQEKVDWLFAKVMLRNGSALYVQSVDLWTVQ